MSCSESNAPDTRLPFNVLLTTVKSCYQNLNACLSPTDSADYSLWLRWASTPNFVEIAWGGIWVLQVLKLCPSLDQERIDQVLAKVQELAALMETWPAKRYSLTMKCALPILSTQTEYRDADLSQSL